MPQLTVTRNVDPPEAERLLAPRQDIVAERAADDGGGDSDRTRARFVLDHGPFAHYERTVTIAPTGGGPRGSPGGHDGDRGHDHDGDRGHDGDGDGAVAVTEEFDYRLPPGTWPFLMNWPFRAALRRPRPDGKLPWWYPPQRPDARSATVLGLLATLSLIVGYHGTLLTQTMTFAADEFGASTAAQGDAFAAVRIGGVLAVGLGMLADRRGRRLILCLSLLGCIASTVLRG